MLSRPYSCFFSILRIFPMLIISELHASLKIACTKTNIRCWILSQGNRGRKNQSVTQCIKITEKCQTSFLYLFFHSNLSNERQHIYRYAVSDTILLVVLGIYQYTFIHTGREFIAESIERLVGLVARGLDL